MRVLSAPELEILVRELQELNGFYIDRFYEVADGKFRIRLSKNKTQVNLQIILSHAINKTEYVEKQEEATNFALAIRKRIEGFLIEKIGQFNRDRIVIFALRKGDERLNMIIEMFGKGNLVITDSAMKILLAYMVNDFKDRSVRPGNEYKGPAASLTKPTILPEKESFIIYRDLGGKAVDYAIEELEKYKGLEQQKFETFQQALDLYYYENPVKQKSEKTEKEKAVEVLESSIAKQERILKSLDAEIESNKRVGETIFNNISEINTMIKAIQSNKRITKEELQGFLDRIKIQNIDLKDRKVRIEI